MKKITFALIALVFAISLNAQELTTKKGMPILPQVGDFSLGIDATPFLFYIGNMVNMNSNNTPPTWNYSANNPFQFTGKYMVNNHTAYRGIFRIGITSNKYKAYSIKDEQADPAITVEDSYKDFRSFIGLGAGMEKRRGKGRLQGIYGAMGMISFGSRKESYSYGNTFGTFNRAPTRHNFGGNNQGNTWVLENKVGTTFGIDVWAFVGVEYFFTAKMSISGEFKYGLSYEVAGDGNSKIEAWDNANNVVKVVDSKTAGYSYFSFDNGIAAALNLNFYF